MKITEVDGEPIIADTQLIMSAAITRIGLLCSRLISMCATRAGLHKEERVGCETSLQL